MASERIQRRLERLLDQLDEAESQGNWEFVRALAEDVLEIDAGNTEAASYLRSALRRLDAEPTTADTLPDGAPASPRAVPVPQSGHPASFANGRYQVGSFLGEGGKKRVYLAHDGILDRDVALAVIKTEGIDEVSRTRITREAQAMGRLGDRPNILQIHDLGEEKGQPYLVLPLMTGGSVEGLISDAPDHNYQRARCL